MGIPLRTLIIEDSEDDSLLVVRALKNGGFDSAYERVETSEAMREALGRETWDLIISDYNMPHFGGLAALKLFQEKGLDIPFIIVSGTIGEETAVAAMVSGAHDYVMKNNLSRLVPAVQRELKDAESRRERKRAEEALRRTEENFRHSLDDSPLGVHIVTAEGETIYANQAILDIYGFSSLEEFRTTPLERRYTAESYIEFKKRKERRRQGEKFPSKYEVSVVRTSGEVRHVLVSRKELFWNGKKQYQALYNDITERKKAEETLQSSLREKEAMLGEIHHRVKNNMQVISSLFNLQSGHTTNEECREILKEGQTRIRAMSLVHEQLYKSHNLSRIDLAGYIQSLVIHLFHVYKVSPGQIRLDTEFEEMTLDINSANPCGLIINELISNALKHAFPNGRAGVIKIGLRQGTGGAVELRVADDGIGFPKNLDFCHAESFGLQIVNLLVDQLDATLTLDRDQGTAFTVTFRELEYAPRI